MSEICLRYFQKGHKICGSFKEWHRIVIEGSESINL